VSHSFFSGNSSSYHFGPLRKGKVYYQPENEACAMISFLQMGFFLFTEGLLDANTGVESPIALPLEPLLPGDAHIF